MVLGLPLINPQSRMGSILILFPEILEFSLEFSVLCCSIFLSLWSYLKEINHTFLALIPKFKPNANHFRPISFCSGVYKVISKIITNGLKITMGKIIHPLQAAFSPERLIQYNILIAYEVFHSFKNKSIKGRVDRDQISHGESL